MNHADPPDELDDLLAQVAQGNRRAFARLYRISAPKLFGILLRILRRADHGEEVLQEVFLTIWQHADEYRPERGSAWPWLVQIARHRALDRLRRNRSGFRALETQENGEQMADPAPAVEQQVLQAQDACRLQRCLEHLTERQRECLQLAYFEGLSHAELAERLGVPLGSVKTWIRRGLIQLKECIET